ncbi:MAG: hypothetical protein ABJA90_11610 [Ginsengibacter sp.]
MKRILLIIIYFLLPVFLVLSFVTSSAQIVVSGTVYDSTKLYVVPGVNVSSTSGLATTTDSLGGYHIRASKADSISFIYKGKSTIKFPVESIGNYNSFDISLRIRTNDKYKLLKGVTVYADTYRRDSIENRMSYAKIFNLENPTIRSNYEPGGAAGLDLDQLIGMFQFRKNKQTMAFQRRLVEDEQDRYIDYRFSSKVIKRITGLSGDTLTRYKKIYRPSYIFVITSTLPDFYEYILNTSYAFKREEGIQ